MDQFIARMDSVLEVINNVLWHDFVLYVILGVGVLFTLWSAGAQYHSLTHGVSLTRGKYDNKKDPGAINHFQALSTALSGTVGLGNIAGVSVAVSLGGPGAVFWMWIVGIVGMAIKTTEVTLSMMYRNVDNPEEPHGGPMWVASKGFAKWGLGPLGKIVGGIFCVTLIISTITGGNMFQAWNVTAITRAYIPSIPGVVIGIVMALMVGLVIIGGIKRIGSVTGRLVPFMCVLYLLAAVYVLLMNIGEVPGMLVLIFKSAFEPAEAQGAFLGGTAGYAFLWGMKRALFSNEAGQGSSPIAHSAAKTREPAREGIVAGLEPFIDTLVVCTLTALVMLSSGAWNREPAAAFETTPTIVPVEGKSGEWTVSTTDLPKKTADAERSSNVWRANDQLFVLVRGRVDSNTGRDIHRLTGRVVAGADGVLGIAWDPHSSEEAPTLIDGGIHLGLVGAALTGYAFDRVTPGLGMWIVTAACWLFAVSTIISWYYYGEQGALYLMGRRAILPYKLIYCALIILSTLDFIRTDAQLDAWTALGTGVMLFANIPIMILFGSQAMAAYHAYIRRLKAGQFEADRHEAPPITKVAEGGD